MMVSDSMNGCDEVNCLHEVVEYDLKDGDEKSGGNSESDDNVQSEKDCKKNENGYVLYGIHFGTYLIYSELYHQKSDHNYAPYVISDGFDYNWSDVYHDDEYVFGRFHDRGNINLGYVNHYRCVIDKNIRTMNYWWIVDFLIWIDLLNNLVILNVISSLIESGLTRSIYVV